MVVLYVMSSGEIWVGCDTNIAKPGASTGNVIACHVIDENPATQKVGTFGGVTLANLTHTAVSGNTSVIPKGVSGGIKGVDIH
jgi:hypothetical protein